MATITDSTKGSPTLDPIARGNYDALVQAVIWLENQEYTNFSGKKVIGPKVKIVFEIPDLTDDEGTSRVIAKTVNATTNEKGTLCKIVSATQGVALTSSELKDVINESETGALHSLLGKAVVLTVDQFNNDAGDTMAYIKEFSTLDKRLPTPKQNREQVFFDPTNPDMAMYEKLTRYTKKQMMSATNASDFPKELHDAYLKEQEDANIDNNSNTNSSEFAAIQ